MTEHAKLEWIPIYIDRLLSSPRYQAMEDYQRGWYLNLLFHSARSERIGFLRLDSNLWTIAGAKRRDFFDSHKAAVLACFKVREIEGQSWIFNERFLQTVEDQSEKIGNSLASKRVKNPSYSYSQILGSKEKNKEEVRPKTDEMCTTCGDQGVVRQLAKNPGPRLIPCPHCSNSRNASSAGSAMNQ